MRKLHTNVASALPLQSMMFLLSLWLVLSYINLINCFLHPRGWIAGVGSHLPSKELTNWNEIYIGNLPSTYDNSKLSTLLRQHKLTGFTNVSVLSYGTLDGHKYGSVSCLDGIADGAMNVLDNTVVEDQQLEIALMPKTCNICGTIYEMGEEEIRLLKSFAQQNFASVNFPFNHLERVYLTCSSPALTCRLLGQLTRHDWKRRAVFNLHQPMQVQIRLNNISPEATVDDLVTLMKELSISNFIGVNYISAAEEHSTRGHAYVLFDQEEEAVEAVKLLNGCMIHDKPLLAVLKGEKPSTRLFHKMYLGNLDPSVTLADLEHLCEEVLGSDRDKVTRIKQNVHRLTGRVLPSCKVSFSSEEVMHRCITALNGRMWHGRPLIAASGSSADKWANTVFISNIPRHLADSQIKEWLESHLGPDLPVRTFQFKLRAGDGSRYAFVSFLSQDQAVEARQRLCSVPSDGVRLRAFLNTKMGD